MQLISDLGHWVLDWADTPWGALALLVLAFWESSFFPIPPDGLMIALMVGNLPFTFGFAALATVGSLTGAMLGYWIGLRGRAADSEPAVRGGPHSLRRATVPAARRVGRIHRGVYAHPL